MVSLRLPEPRIAFVAGQTHPKKKIAILPHEITHHSIMRNTTQQSEQQQQLLYLVEYCVYGTMVLAGRTSYHARVLHRQLHDVQVERKIIDHQHSSSISLDGILHKCTVHIICTTAAATYRPSRISYLARQQHQSVEVATNGSCANRHTNI